MPALPVISGDECMRALERVGYARVRQRGNHVRMRCPGRKHVTVPLHRTLRPGTLRGIIEDAGLTVDEFVALL